MAIRRWILLLLSVSMISTLIACGGGSTVNVQNQPAPSISKPSIAFQSAVPAAIQINTTTSLAAVVSGDPSNTGVDWSLTCAGNVNCGTLSLLHTSSGKATLYTPPAALAGNSQTVTIAAFATADHTVNVVAPITIGAFGSNLKGSFVLQVQGLDSAFNPYQFAGLVVFDGNGGITSGEQTINFSDPTTGLFVTKIDTISSTGSSYFLGADGRGTITINPSNDADIGAEVFSFVLLSSSQGLISVRPTSNLQISGNGTMDMQTWTPNSPALSAGYAFVVSGTDFSTASLTSIGGVFNIDSIPNNPNNISGSGSISDENLGGTMITNQGLSGTISNPDPFGAVTLTLNSPNFSTPSLTFTGYIVDATHMKLIESDNTAGLGAGSTAGIAIGQGTATGSFASNTSFSGTYVFGALGTDLNVFIPNTATSVGVFTADGAGNFTNGFTDTLLLSGIQISGSFGGKYFTDANGTGRIRSTFTGFVPPPKPVPSLVYFMYLTGNGNPALIMAGPNSLYPYLAAGIAYPQSTSAPALAGRYGFTMTQQNFGESDGIGQLTANSTTDTLSGVVDMDSNFNLASGNPLTGTFASPGANGVYAGTLNSQVFDFFPFVADFYSIDPAHGFFVETDLINPNNPSGVVSFGYYAARTPVCPSCP